MNKKSFTLVGYVLVAAVVAGITYTLSSGPLQTDATQAEVDMANMMGITVEELRNQTPEEHMRMMQDMMNADERGQGTMMHGKDERDGFMAGENIDVSSLPEVLPSEVMEVDDGDVIELNPTLVRKEINGKQFAMYGYNGQIPGPIIKADRGTEITVNVTNRIDMPTTIHWHGIRIDNAFDGVPDVTQEEIKPDGSFMYTVAFDDEGIYWYHPHVREDIQQDLGLYGNLLVTPDDTDAYAPVNREEILVLDDILLDDDGNLVPHGRNDADRPLMGRFGNVVMVNGEFNKTIDVQQGSVVRLFVTNVANTRTFKFSVPRARMKLVGSDIGRYERETPVDSVIIAPAERYVVDVLFEEAGTYELMHDSPLATFALTTFEVSQESAQPSHIDAFDELRVNEDVIADIDSFRQHFDKPVDKTLRLTIDMAGGMDHSMMMDTHTDDGIEWEDTMAVMNDMMSGDQVAWKMIDAETGKENMEIDWQFNVGDVVKVRIINENDSAHPMQHPVHFHGQRFLVLSQDDVPNENLVWKDTVLVPTGSTVDLLFDMSNPGDWMFHCHIAEHLTNGMMGMMSVSE